MFNLDDITSKNNKEHNKKWPYISNYPYRVLIIGSSGSGKTNISLNLIKEQDDNDKIYLYAEDLSEPKYEFLIKKREKVGIKHSNDLKAFMSVQILWIMFLRILMITTQTDKEKV